MATNLRAVIGKLNTTTRNALEGAAGLCLSRTHYDVEIEHFLMKLLDVERHGFACIIAALRGGQIASGGRTHAQPRQAEIGQRPHARHQPIGAEDVDGGLDDSGRSNTTPSDPLGLSRSWRWRPTRSWRGSCARPAGIPEDQRRRAAQGVQPPSWPHPSEETQQPPLRRPRAGRRAAAQGRRQDAEPGSIHREPHGERAKAGKIDPVLGARFRNPPGGRYPDPPPPEQPHPGRRSRRGQDRRGGGLCPAHRRRATCRRLCGTSTVRTLDLALLQAGAGVKGEFENRLKGLINEVKSSPTPDHPVHRRGAHHDRRGRRRRARATPPTC